MYARYQSACPNCGDKLSVSQTRCDCGWSKSENAESHDPRCIFVLNGERCPLPGSHSNSTLKNNDWKCTYHHENIGNNFEGARWMGFIKQNLAEIVHFRKHYYSNLKNCERCSKLCDAEDIFTGRPPRSSFSKIIVGPQKPNDRFSHLELPEASKKLMRALDEKYFKENLSDEEFFKNENKGPEEIIF